MRKLLLKTLIYFAHRASRYLSPESYPSKLDWEDILNLDRDEIEKAQQSQLIYTTPSTYTRSYCSFSASDIKCYINDKLIPTVHSFDININLIHGNCEGTLGNVIFDRSFKMDLDAVRGEGHLCKLTLKAATEDGFAGELVCEGVSFLRSKWSCDVDDPCLKEAIRFTAESCSGWKPLS